MGPLERLVLASLPFVPRPIMRRLAARYIAGETLDEALAKLRDLAARGHSGILDMLGEDVADESEARAAAAGYRAAATAVHAAGLDSHISIKPTHLGLRISPQLAHELYAELAEHCRPLEQLVRVEMEDHTTTDATLGLFAELQARFDNVGIALQSRLLRTLADIDALPSGPVDVRLVKGVYLEPASIAHTAHDAIRDAFVDCAERILDGGHVLAMATHDELLADRLLRLLDERGLGPERAYFEVLLGVRQPLWERWKAAGHTVRVYVPYGPEWRSYSQRRLRKNPELLRHMMRNVLRR